MLFAISVGCFCVVLWIALAAARRIQRGRRRPRPSSAEIRSGVPRVAASLERPTQEIFEAGEFRTPRSLRLVQSVAPKSILRPSGSRDLPGPPPSDASADSLLASLSTPPNRNLTLNQATSPSPSPSLPKASLVQEAAPERRSPDPGEDAVPTPSERLSDIPERRWQGLAGRKKEARGVVLQREDWALYNKDLGDLTDPYTQPVRIASNGRNNSRRRS